MSAHPSRRSALAYGAGALLTATVPFSHAWGAAALQRWLSRTLKLVVGFPGGSSPDLVARTLAEPLSQALGQTVVVENRVGAGGNVAASAVARATDDHTLGVMINGNMTIAKLIQPRLNYDPLKDFAPVSLIGTAPLALAAPVNAPGTTAQEFFTAARNSGSAWNYGTPGVGTVAHIGMELLKSKSHMQAVHVPYAGNPQVINALLGGQVQLALLPPAMAAAQARGGKLRIIGVTSASRSSLVPQYASLAEAGVQDFNLEIWNAVAAPKSMPPQVVARLSALLSEIARRPEVREKLFQQGWKATGTTAEGLARRVEADAKLLGDVIRTHHIEAQ